MRKLVHTSILVSALVAATTAGADSPKPAKAKDAIEPEAVAALEKMGMFLRQQQSFTVHTETATDYVLENGQKVQLAGRGEIAVRRPDRLRAEMKTERKDREFFYDGKTFTMNGRQINMYATVPAPPTIHELADTLEEKYDIELPMVDLFRWGSDEDTEKDITSAMLVGRETIAGVQVDHYAFRQPGLDWQIWIQHGDKPLPRKLVLTTTDNKARPEHSIDMAWDLNAKHPDSEFAFVPSKDSMKIALEGGEPEQSAKR